MTAIFATRDAVLANSFANDPDILPWCGYPAGTTHVDVSDKVANPDLVFVTDGIGAMICFERDQGEWQFHSMFRRSCRGRKAIDMALAMFRWLADREGAGRIFGVCPINNRAVTWFCRQLGMVLVGTSQHPTIGSVQIFRKELSCL